MSTSAWRAPERAGQRQHRGGDVGGAGARGEQQLADAQAEVEGEVEPPGTSISWVGGVGSPSSMVSHLPAHPTRARARPPSPHEPVPAAPVERWPGADRLPRLGRATRSAWSGSSRSSTAAPATCATTPPTSSPGPGPGCPHPEPAAPGAAAQHRRARHRRLRHRRRGDGRPAGHPRRRCSPAGDDLDLDLYGAGTHPFALVDRAAAQRGPPLRGADQPHPVVGPADADLGRARARRAARARPGDAGAVRAAQLLPPPAGALGLLADLGRRSTPATPPTGR